VWPGSFIRFINLLSRYLRTWALAEVGAGRLVPWLAVGFGTGIVLYFTADREPAIWAAVLVAGIAITAAIAVRRSPIGFPVALAIAVIAAGFATATLKRAFIAHPVIQSPAWSVQIAGFVETREERERSDRIVVAVNRIEGPRLTEKPERVRLSVRKGMAPPVGSFVQLKARLAPPLEPLSPGSYDFARDMYFHGIGASGFVLGRIQITKPAAEGGFWLRYLAMIDDMPRHGVRVNGVISAEFPVGIRGSSPPFSCAF
jgi:competence protein ComEC